ncbi:MAG: glycoside hydrolase family 3 C-terminal domain-containing protein [Bacteroidia bacterium]|nr:glycoside hydrolase family 3 C-terminal domain-containing protein [Bacteroidia bacterium]
MIRLFFTLCGFALLVGCTTKKQVEYPFQDSSLTIEERVEDLMGRLTLEEKVALMQNSSEAIDRLGIKEYDWWNEVLHGVARAGNATVFPQTIGMAASFDVPLVHDVFTAISDEARVKHRQFVAQGNRGRYTGLTVWTPNINIFRDPRWGRGQETYGEDPYLTGEMGKAVVTGLQDTDENGIDKLHACAKHFAVHSGPEWNRHTYNAENIPTRDLHETYLWAFKELVTKADVREVMCAYNRYEGEPCCGSSRLLTRILREDWGYKGIVVSDCWALNDFYNPIPKGHGTEPDAEHTAAKAVLSGTDLECGSTFDNLDEAVAAGLITEERVNTSVRRLLKARFQLGEFDDPETVSWNKLRDEILCSAEHHALARKIATESIVLLQNRDNVLPLSTEGKIAVVGPNATDSVSLWANYNGFPLHTVTILDGIESMVGKENVKYIKGCDYVTRMTMESQIYNCRQENGEQGIKGEYWNNKKMEGEKAAEVVYNNPLIFSTAGATVFAPGVNLEDFSAKYTTDFVGSEDCELAVEVQSQGVYILRVDGDSITFGYNLPEPTIIHTFKTKKGESHKVELDFVSFRERSALRFNIGKAIETMPAEVIKELDGYETVVMVGGISPKLEGEEMPVTVPGFKGGDRENIQLPDVQRELLQELKRVGKRVVFVNLSGSAIGLEPETKSCDAILQAWYGGEASGEAVADVLFGKVSPSGKLPITFYKSVDQIPGFEDYTMKGRTYRYMTTQKPLFPFGYGLSYTTFEFGTPQMPKSIKRGEALNISIPVKNSGNMDGAEVVQVYLSKPSDKEGPVKTLRGVARVDVPAGETRMAELTLGELELSWYNEVDEKMEVMPGEYVIEYGSSSADTNKIKLTITE